MTKLDPARPHRVLLVEDKPEKSVLARMLGALGHPVVAVAMTAEDAVERARSTRGGATLRKAAP